MPAVRPAATSFGVSPTRTVSESGGEPARSRAMRTSSARSSPSEPKPPRPSGNASPRPRRASLRRAIGSRLPVTSARWWPEAARRSSTGAGARGGGGGAGGGEPLEHGGGAPVAVRGRPVLEFLVRRAGGLLPAVERGRIGGGETVRLEQLAQDPAVGLAPRLDGAHLRRVRPGRQSEHLDRRAGHRLLV